MRRKRHRQPEQLPPWFVRECLWRRHPKFGLQAMAVGYEDTSYGGEMIHFALTWAGDHPEQFEAWRARMAAACPCIVCNAGGTA